MTKFEEDLNELIDYAQDYAACPGEQTCLFMRKVKEEFLYRYDQLVTEYLAIGEV